MRLLLDIHIPVAVAQQLRLTGIDAISLAEWRAGMFRTASDSVILSAALEEGRVLVTYDLRSIRSLVLEWSSAGKDHAGVIFVDDKAIRAHEVGRLVRALRLHVEQYGEMPWTNHSDFLKASLTS